MDQVRNCKQEDCPVKASGKCLEGLESEECSHFYWSDKLDDSEIEEIKLESVSNQDNEMLFHGDELAFKDLNAVTHKYNCNTIVIIGESESGKTTILGSIFDLFQLGDFDNYLFAGSMTQVGFEKRCHHSRSSSEGEIPETEKTRSKDFNFLHIAVKPKTFLESPAIHMVLSDISGERFQMARDSSSSMAELTLLRDVDHLILLLDGKKLANKFLRTGVINNAKMFIKRAIDVGVFNKETKLNIVVSKWDLLEDASNFDYQVQIIDHFNAVFSNQLQAIVFDHIAVRPHAESKFNFGDGLEELIKKWTQRAIRSLDLKKVSKDRYAERYTINYE